TAVLIEPAARLACLGAEIAAAAAMRLERFDALPLAVEEPRVAAECRRMDVAHGRGLARPVGRSRRTAAAETRDQQAGRKGPRRADEPGNEELRQVLPVHRPILPPAALRRQPFPRARIARRW